MKLRVAYARSRYRDKVYETPLVVTSYRDENGTPRNKTVVSLAKLPKFLVEVIDKALKRGDGSVLEEYVHVDDLGVSSATAVGPSFVALALLKQLGVFALLQKSLSPKQATAILSIISERVTSEKPLSVMAQQRRFEREPIAQMLGEEKAPALKTWYGALGKLEEKREAILQELYERNHTLGDLFLYDITSSYFEGETCPLSAYGYNRDGKKGKKQVVIGVICDAEGCPIWLDVFRGNTKDETTVRQQLLNLKEKLGVENFTFVGDRGMVTNARIEELEEEGWWESFTYITALKRGEMMKLVEDESHPVQLELFDHKNLTEVEKGDERYVLCHNPLRLKEDRETRLSLLKKTEEKLEKVRKNVASGRYKKTNVIARRLYRWLDHWGMGRFFETEYDEGAFSYRRLEEKIGRYARLDGCYVIRSNVEKSKEDTAGLRERYKNLQFVEQAFRTMKTTDIQVRPIRHFGEPQVRGHIFACFLAYRVVWELRQRLEPVLRRDPDTKRCEAGSLAEIWRDFGSITVAKLEAKGKTFCKISEISPWVRKLLKMCRLPSLEGFLSE